MMRAMRSGAAGQAIVEFSMCAAVLFGLLFGIIDLARIAFEQHAIGQATDGLARGLASVTAANTGSSGNYVPTPLTAAAVAPGYTRVSGASAGSFPSTPLSANGPLSDQGTVLTNGSVTVAGYPNLQAPQVITVTASAPFTMTNPFMHGVSLRVAATAESIPPLGQ